MESASPCKDPERTGLMTKINNRQIKVVKDGQRPKDEHSILLDCTDQDVTSGGYLKERLNDEKGRR